ncbi:uncharacterized protein EV154DRAFT_485378 [Mucor mucedo]|uniref:uncharacterized protein n=1 Tax=Mucor mucedo TaxID=29922 RepID=UPI00221F1AFA|nr:uncharacterized protein EV154DRAFT_485378 [Mucor mucedo]KAI7884446.1 hypothetical protein EV154DRAFT_485378 [Mucor mucedo]
MLESWALCFRHREFTSALRQCSEGLPKAVWVGFLQSALLIRNKIHTTDSYISILVPGVSLLALVEPTRFQEIFFASYNSALSRRYRLHGLTEVFANLPCEE